MIIFGDSHAAALGNALANSGVDSRKGASTVALSRDLPSLEVAAGDVVLIVSGTNDAGASASAERAAVRAIVARARADSPGARVVLVGPPAVTRADLKAALPRIARILAAAAAESGAGFIDAAALTRGFTGPDGAHLTAEGYRALAAGITSKLSGAYLPRDRPSSPARWIAGGLALVGLVGLVVLAVRSRTSRSSPPRRRNPWITLSNRRRVEIDDEGRVEHGLPEEFHGVHVEDISPLSRAIRQADRDASSCAHQAPRARGTFSSKAAAVAELLDANPELRELADRDDGAAGRAYSSWVAGGRRGPKPALARGDGRFDFINERLDLHGRRRVSTWREAISRSLPSSRRWADIDETLELLGEGTGFELAPPASALEYSEASRAREACAEGRERYVDELVGQARRGRLRLVADDEVPF